MKWLSIEYIRKHSRIDCHCEDDLLMMYGEAAEETILNLCNRTYESMTEEYGQMPAPLYQAALMLVDLSYQQRSPVSPVTMSVVPYTFDILIKPYMKLTV